jgi:CheY-like chemotaxis protein
VGLDIPLTGVYTTAAGQERGGKLMLRPESILLVDDNELVLTCLKRFFTREFHHVVAVCTGEEAVRHSERHFFHIVVLDLHLPGIDGWEVLAHIKRHSPRSLVVIATSCTDSDIRQKALQRGAFEYLEKPFEFDELKAIVTRMQANCQWERKMHAPLEVRFDRVHRGFTYNLTATDMFVLTAVPFDLGATVRMTLHVPGQEPIPITGKVVKKIHSDCGVLPLFSERDEIGAAYGIGVRLVEQSAVYASLVSSLACLPSEKTTH